MDGLEAIDEELEALREGTDVEGILAKAHGDLPDHSQGFDVVDAMLENLGEAVSIPTVQPVGVDIPKLELPEIQAVAEPALAEPAREIPDTAVHPSVPPADPEPPPSAVEMAREADAGVDDILDGTPSESGLDANDLFGDLGADSPATEDVVDISDALAQVRAMTSEMPPAEAPGSESVADAEAPSMEASAAQAPSAEAEPAPRPRTEPPPPPAEAGTRDSIEELDLDELMIEDDFELMIDEDDDGDTFVGDADAVENALAGEQEPSASPPPPPGAESSGEGEGGEGGEDDAREQSFFKKLFG